MELTNLCPHRVNSATYHAICQFDRSFDRAMERFINRHKVRTRRKYFFFGPKIEIIWSEEQVRTYYADEVMILECRWEYDREILHSLARASKVAMEQDCLMTLTQREWVLIELNFIH